MNASRARQEQDVAVVTDAGAGQVRVREAEDAVVVEVIAGTSVPAFEARVGAELHHAERHARTGERVAVAAGADERIDVAQRVGVRTQRHGGQRTQEPGHRNPDSHAAQDRGRSAAASNRGQPR